MYLVVLELEVEGEEDVQRLDHAAVIHWDVEQRTHHTHIVLQRQRQVHARQRHLMQSSSTAAAGAAS
jgi:hypothetical protein